MSTEDPIDDNDVDSGVDEVIASCLSLDQPSSFFLFAGAGSGKTKSLVQAIEKLLTTQRRRLMLRGQRIGVITYTNAARDEVMRRINFDPLVEVATIHSFVWTLIEGFDEDIRVWLHSNLSEELEDLRAKQTKSKGDNQTTRDRAKKISSKERRLAGLPDVRRFTYNPNGDNSSRDSLSHTEVISIAANFLTKKSLMQEILVSGFPVLLVDESQDTTAELLDSLMEVQSAKRSSFALGLFGDQMQRIYTAGKTDLGIAPLPADWKTPAKVMNHRCPTRVVDLINKIRSTVDDQRQRPRRDAKPGLVRLFIVDGTVSKTREIENKVAETMAGLTGDEEWLVESEDTKRLILEHHMAAKRMGFSEMFEPLYKSSKLSTGVLDGSLTELKFFLNEVVPLVDAQLSGDEFGVASVVRRSSPLVSKENLRLEEKDQVANLRRADAAVQELCKLWDQGSRPTFGQVLAVVAKTALFNIPTSLRDFTEVAVKTSEPSLSNTSTEEDSDVSASDLTEPWRLFLNSDFEQIRHYGRYVQGKAGFDTHQGVKGLEFPRVMVIMDDEEAKGFLFSYEKLFGAKAPSKTDLENEQSGKETGIDRTRRLFYVTCSRAKSSLALLAYSANPSAVKQQALKHDWFSEDEIVLF